MRKRILIVDELQQCPAMVRADLEMLYELEMQRDPHNLPLSLTSFAPQLVILFLTSNNDLRHCRTIRWDDCHTRRLLAVVEEANASVRVSAYEAGADDVVMMPIVPGELVAKVAAQLRVQDLLEKAQAHEARLQEFNSELVRLVDARTAAVEATQDVAVFALAKLADSRDPATGEHLERIRRFSQLLAEHLRVDSPYSSQISEQFLEDLYRSSPLHDIGKVGTSDSILLKPGPLTTDEFEIMKRHAVLGAQTLEQAAEQSTCGSFLDMAAQIARHHHERFDGTGYPDGLAGLDIPLAARIVTLADVFDALTSERVYKEAYPPEVARQMIESESGKHFDPVIVDAFRACYPKFLEHVGGQAESPFQGRANPTMLPRWRVATERTLRWVASQSVLWVDSDPTAISEKEWVLQEAGYELDTASTVADAQEKLRRNCPQFVICDWELSDGRAADLCQWVRQERLPRYVYLIVTSTDHRNSRVMQVLDSGADDFLPKPAKEEELVARLRAGRRVIALEHELGTLARIDPLTRVATQHCLAEQVEREWRRAVRYHLPLSYAVIDIDGFDELNRTRGYSAGDEVLKAIADLATNHCRATDYLCRHGGGRFLVMLAETNEYQAVIWADRMRALIDEASISVGNERVHCSVSIGVAQRQQDTAQASAIVDMAEEALRVAKRSGRNRTVRHSSLHDPGQLAEDAQLSSKDPFRGVRARDVMRRTIWSVPHTMPAQDVTRHLLERNLNAAPVVDEDGRLVGMISEQDLLNCMVSASHWRKPVHFAMTRKVICYGEDTPLREIYEFLTRGLMRRVVIVDNGRPVGVISRTTILRWFESAARRILEKSAAVSNGSHGDMGNALIDTVADSAVELASEVRRSLQKAPQPVKAKP